MILHLASVILFQQHTGCIVHVPGKLVPFIINHLESFMSTEQYSILARFQKLATLKWKASTRNKHLEDQEVEVESSPEATASEHKDTLHLPENADEQLITLIEQLKVLVVKPPKSVVPNS